MKDTTQKAAQRKIAFKFVAVMLVCYLLFSQGNIFMNSVLSPGGRFNVPFLEEYFNYIQALRIALIAPGTWIIRLFGYYAIHNDMQVLIAGGPILIVNYSCLGLGMMSFLAAFLIAFPAKAKAKWKMFAIGVLTIYILNVLRIAFLGLLVTIFESQRTYFEYHHEIFNVFVYIVIFFMLFKWIKRNNDQPRPDAA